MSPISLSDCLHRLVVVDNLTGACTTSGHSGTPRSRLSRPSCLCQCSMFLCCRWWNSCRTSSSSSPRVCRLLPSRLSMCPRSHKTGLSSAWLTICVHRRRPNSWWKCQRSYPIVQRNVDFPVPHCRCGRGGLQQRLVEHNIAFTTVVSLDSAEQRFVDGLMVEVLKIFAEDKAQQLVAEVVKISLQDRVHHRLVELALSLDRVQQRLVELIFAPGASVCKRFLEGKWGGRECACDECTFPHSWAELHPEASAHEYEMASYFDAGVRGLAPGDCARAVRTWKFGHYWLLFFRNTWLDSGYRFFDSSWRILDEFPVFSSWRWARILRAIHVLLFCFFFGSSSLEKCAQSLLRLRGLPELLALGILAAVSGMHEKS